MEIYRMKKSLFALAATTAIAGAAQAQSSVTVYGIMDLGYYGTNTSATAQSTGTLKTQTSRITNGNESTSRLGFKGTEDLGGGSSAFFTVELGLLPADASLTGYSVAQTTFSQTTDKGGSAIDNRQSFVGLKKNGLGQVTLGRQYTLAYDQQSATSPTGNATQVGSVLYPQGGSSGSGINSDAAMTLRASNTIILSSDDFKGFKANAMYALNNANATQNSVVGSGNTNWNGWGLGANYTWNKLYVTYNYQSFKTQYSTGVASSAYMIDAGLQATQGTTIAAGGTNVMWSAQNTSDKQQYAGATYDFGILKAYAGWTGRKVQDANTTYQINRNAQQIGVRSYITPVIEAWGAIGNGNIKDSTTGTAHFSAWQVGSNYYLSKRTNLYAIYGQSVASNVASTSSGINAASQNGYSLGLRHTF
jgi:predicted porin